MSQILQRDRNGCALHGALHLLDAIDGVVPILHANAGCGINAHFVADAGGAGRLRRAAAETATTALHDKHVVFGGTSRLREQIKNTVKVLAGELYVVASGCVPEVVGDDLPAMVKEAVEQRFPVLGLSSPGFKGNAYHGYAEATKALLAGVADLAKLFGAPAAPSAAPDVNLLGLVPMQDPQWEGDLLAIEALLADLGLRSNRLAGVDQGLAGWRAAGRARLSLVLSPWGLAAARFLEQRHAVPYLYLGWLPVGWDDSAEALAHVAAALAVDEATRGRALTNGERRFRHFLAKAAPHWLRDGWQKRVAVVAGSAYAVGLARFLAGAFGQELRAVIVTDEPPEDTRDALAAAIRQQAPSCELHFSASQEEIAGRLIAAAPEFVFGSALEAGAAAALGAPLLQVSAPLAGRFPLVRSYAGAQGALALVEDFGAALAASVPAPADAASPSAAGCATATRALPEEAEIS